MHDIPGSPNVLQGSSPGSTPFTTSTENTSSCSSIDLEKTRHDSLASDKFTKWRPSYHFMPPKGWMNDPCAPHHNPHTGLYHLYYQWNPYSADWADISWGTATSKDMVTWKLEDRPALIPDQPYDNKGIFTGCMVESTHSSMTCVYTSVNHLPIHYTQPHPRGCESLSMAQSADGGLTWHKYDQNPILSGEPEGLDVCGWRDPYVAEWPRLCQVLNRDPDSTLFGIIAGGIRDVTPTVFLYAIDKSRLTEWEYLGPLFCGEQNFRLSRWSGDLGKNWEVANFVSLTASDDKTVTRDFLIMGTEGCLAYDDVPQFSAAGPHRPLRGQLWISGALKGTESAKYGSRALLDHKFGGHLDHGLFYAANSFFDPILEKQIVWGWITEEDLSEGARQAQGWSGLLSLPRELSIQTIRNVIGSCASSLESITSIETEEDDHGSLTVRTLLCTPVPSVVQTLRRSARKHTTASVDLDSNANFSNLTFDERQLLTKCWELECSFTLSKQCSSVGFSLIHGRDPISVSSTTISFDPRREQVMITRPESSSSNSSQNFNSEPETAPHTLFTMRDPVSKKEHVEALHIRVWRDNSCLEVFVNDRTAISTRIYAGETTLGLAFFANDGEKQTGETTRLLSATLWDGLSASI